MATNTESKDRSDLRVVQPPDANDPREAMALLEHAHRVAEDTLATARAEAERLLADARRDAEATRAQAQDAAERILADARGNVAELEQHKERLASERESAISSAREFANRLLALVDDEREPGRD